MFRQIRQTLTLFSPKNSSRKETINTEKIQNNQTNTKTPTVTILNKSKDNLSNYILNDYSCSPSTPSTTTSELEPPKVISMKASPYLTKSITDDFQEMSSSYDEEEDEQTLQKFIEDCNAPPPSSIADNEKKPLSMYIEEYNKLTK